jgi:hypothetical protein
MSANPFPPRDDIIAALLMLATFLVAQQVAHLFPSRPIAVDDVFIERGLKRLPPP